MPITSISRSPSTLSAAGPRKGAGAAVAEDEDVCATAGSGSNAGAVAASDVGAGVSIVTLHGGPSSSSSRDPIVDGAR